MNKKLLNQIFLDSVKNGWITFKEEGDKESIIMSLKEGDLEEAFSIGENSTIENGYDEFYGLRDEWENLGE